MPNVVFGFGEPTCIDIHLSFPIVSFFFFFFTVLLHLLCYFVRHLLKTSTGLSKNNAAEDINTASGYIYMQYTPNYQKNKTPCTTCSNATQ